jgi:hypothetical protein
MVAASAAGESNPRWQSGYYRQTGSYDFGVGGSMQTTLFAATQPAARGVNDYAASAAATLIASAHDDIGGIKLGLNTAFQIYHDRLSGDNYGNDLVQKIYLAVETPYGDWEVGMNDGAAFTLAVTGPVVDGEVALDNPNATFFRDPANGGHAFIENFAFNGAVEPSYNFAKFSYYTPDISGLRFGVSFTPSYGKNVLPYLSPGPKDADREENIFEAGAAYQNNIGALEINLSAGTAFGHDNEQTKTSGHSDLLEWAAGSELAYHITEKTRLAVGGAYHRSNSFGFDIDDVRSEGYTESLHASTRLEYDGWEFGVEYGDGTAKGSVDDNTVGMRGFGAAVGYAINSQLKATLGWQKLLYRSNLAVFYNEQTHIGMDALFLHLHLDIPPEPANTQ